MMFMWTDFALKSFWIFEILFEFSDFFGRCPICVQTCSFKLLSQVLTERNFDVFIQTNEIVPQTLIATENIAVCYRKEICRQNFGQIAIDYEYCKAATVLRNFSRQITIIIFIYFYTQTFDESNNFKTILSRFGKCISYNSSYNKTQTFNFIFKRKSYGFNQIQITNNF